VGTCLSGGIDSSTIVKLIDTDKQKTFSAIFSDERFSENEYLKHIISHSNVSASFVTPTSYDLIKDIDKLIYIQDEPFGSLSIYAQYRVMELAKGKVKVLLDGQGADELFAGYLAYQQVYIKDLIGRNKFGKALMELVGSIYQHSDFYLYAIKQVIIRKKRKGLLLINYEDDRYTGGLNKVLYNELFHTNLPSLLRFEDRNSMAFSIESRVPYLDTDLSEYVMSLPYNQKIRNGISKFSLREAVYGIIPNKIRTRRDKMGFVTPEEVWMKGELKDYILNIMESESFKSRIFWYAHKTRLDYMDFLSGKTNYSPEIWRIICVELWMRKFFDGRTTLYSEKS
jgi:asparagine synthase (glutamine-hydrolysing)